MRHFICVLFAGLLSLSAHAGFDDECYENNNYPVHSVEWTLWDTVLAPIAYTRTWATSSVGTIPLYLWWDLGDFPNMISYFTIVSTSPPLGSPPPAGQYNFSGDTTSYGIFEEPPGSGEYEWVQNPNGDSCWAVIDII